MALARFIFPCQNSSLKFGRGNLNSLKLIFQSDDIGFVSTVGIIWSMRQLNFHNARRGYVHILSNLLLIDFRIKIGNSSFNWHATPYYCTIILEYHFNHLEFRAKEFQIYLIVSQRIASLSQGKLRGNTESRPYICKISNQPNDCFCDMFCGTGCLILQATQLMFLFYLYLL